MCKIIGAENLRKPPPPLPLAKGDTPKQTVAIREYEDAQKIKDAVCGPGEIAYPKSVGTPLAKSSPQALHEDETGPQGFRASRSQHTPGHRWVSTTAPQITGRAMVDINVSAPTVETTPDTYSFSLAQLNVAGNEGWYTVELGWQQRVGVPEPRLFTYVNNDSYRNHGTCESGGSSYNCHFIPLVGAEYLPGQLLTPSDVPYNWQTLRFGLQVFNDDWYVWVGDQWIGYLDGDFWQSPPFSVGSHTYFYGEVYDASTGTTDMGNGNWGTSDLGARMGNAETAVFKNGQWAVTEHTVNSTNLKSTHPQWYNGGYISGDGRSWKFGGPGTG